MKLIQLELRAIGSRKGVLREHDERHGQGLIHDEEYAAIKAEILRTM